MVDDRLAVAEQVKEYGRGPPPDDCLKCGTQLDLYDGFNVTWSTHGQVMEGEPDAELGSVCVSCIRQFLGREAEGENE